MNSLRVQDYLRSGKSLSDLAAEHSIKVARSDHFGLVILNYSQTEGVKRDPVQMECRGLVLEQGMWHIKGRSFLRFFNAGECPDLEKRFDWAGFSAEEKCDGSLMTLFHHQGLWLVTTRGSFADGEIQPGMGKWEEHFWNCVPDEKVVDALPVTHSFVFEFCSRLNKVVRDHPTPSLFLLTVIDNESGKEESAEACDIWASRLGVFRPRRYEVDDLASVVSFVQTQGDPTFEGCVLRDRNGMRLKVKNPSYVALHHLKDNGNVFAEKNLVPLVLKNEQYEVLSAFPEAAEKVSGVVNKLAAAKAELSIVWGAAKGIESQKDFAIFVNKHTPLSSILFEARKKKVEPEELWPHAGDLLLKKLFA